MDKIKTVSEIIEEIKEKDAAARKLYGDKLNIIPSDELPASIGNNIRKNHIIAALFIIIPSLLTIFLSNSLWFYIIVGFIIAIYLEVNSFAIFLTFYNGNAMKICGLITSIKQKGILKKSNKIIQFVDDYDQYYCVEVPYNSIGDEDSLITVYVHKDFCPQPSSEGLLINNYLYICYYKDNGENIDNNLKSYETIMKNNVE